MKLMGSKAIVSVFLFCTSAVDCENGSSRQANINIGQNEQANSGTKTTKTHVLVLLSIEFMVFHLHFDFAM